MLPKISQPVFTLQLPISNKSIQYRPMLVREEKMLLVAKESRDITDMIVNLATVISNCIINPQMTIVDVYNMPLVEFEYIFVNLRSKSIGNVIELRYQDQYDPNITHNLTVDVNDIKLTTPKTYDPIVKITETLGIKMKLPTVCMMLDLDQQTKNISNIGIDFLVRCVDYIFDGDEIYNASEYSDKEINTFLGDLSLQSFNNIEQYFVSLPSLFYQTSYKNSKGEVVKLTLTRLQDFF